MYIKKLPEIAAISSSLFMAILAAYILDLSIDATVSLAIFFLVVLVTLLKWEYRLAISLFGVSILFYLGILKFEEFIVHTNLDIIIFLLAMMIIVGYLEENNYFTYLISKIIKYMHGSGVKTIALLMLMGAFFSAIVDEVTAILFMIAITLEIAAIYEVDPYPLILAVTFSVIIGGTATLMGDPVAIIIAFEGNLTMSEFLNWATPITILNLFILLAIIILFIRRELREMTRHMEKLTLYEVVETIKRDKPVKTRLSTILLIGVLTLIVFHDPLSQILSNLLNKEVTSEIFLIGSPLILASILLLVDWKSAKLVLLHRVDWMTLLFFMFFFVIVGSLEVTGVLRKILDSILILTGNSELKIFLFITILSGVLSIFIANVMTVATIAPLIRELSLMGLHVYPLWWGVLFASVFMALSTPVGTAASLVMLGMLDRHKIGRVSFRRWIKIGMPSAIITTVVSILNIFVRGFLL